MGGKARHAGRSTEKTRIAICATGGGAMQIALFVWDIDAALLLASRSLWLRRRRSSRPSTLRRCRRAWTTRRRCRGLPSGTQIIFHTFIQQMRHKSQHGAARFQERPCTAYFRAPCICTAGAMALHQASGSKRAAGAAVLPLEALQVCTANCSGDCLVVTESAAAGGYP